MTVATTLARAKYKGDGITKVFPFNFRFDVGRSKSILKTYDKYGIETIHNDNEYDVLVISQNGGDLIFPKDPLALPLCVDSSMIFERTSPLTQDIDFTNQGELFAEQIEESLDSITMLVQENYEKVSTSSKEDAERAAESAKQAQLVLIENLLVKDQVEGIRDEAGLIKDKTEILRNETEGFKDRSETIHAEVIMIKDETVSIRDETQVLRDVTEVLKNDAEEASTLISNHFWQGGWVPDREYKESNRVTAADGSEYLCLVKNINVDPTTDIAENFWTVAAKGGIKGEKGEIGDKGVQGDKGEIGDKGVQGDKGEIGDDGVSSFGASFGRFFVEEGMLYLNYYGEADQSAFGIDSTGHAYIDYVP